MKAEAPGTYEESRLLSTESVSEDSIEDEQQTTVSNWSPKREHTQEVLVRGHDVNGELEVGSTRRANSSASIDFDRDTVIVEPPPEAKSWDTKKLPLSLRVNGRYINPWDTWHWKGFWDLLRWKLFTPDKSDIPGERTLNTYLPIVPVNSSLLETQPPPNHFRLVWFGHSSLLIQFEGFNILTDPIFSKRCSPLKHLGPKRYRGPPCTIDDLPRIHVILISHDHYDHFDERTLKKILSSPKNSKVHVFVPQGILSRIRRLKIDCYGDATFTELSWWQKAKVGNRLEVILSPVQHWSKRTAFDIFETLWGGFIVIGKEFRFFFGGDTAYCPVFRSIGELYGPFDCAAIPIGAYSPRWFMKGQHVDPYEAVKIHKDIRSKLSIAIHWGTFVLTNEHYLEPPKLLEEALREANIPKEQFLVLKHGECIERNWKENNSFLSPEQNGENSL